jgi:ribosomal protein S27E
MLWIAMHKGIFIKPGKRAGYYKTYRTGSRSMKMKFMNVECPSCYSTIAYIFWRKKMPTSGFCPDCGEIWDEV